MTTSGAQGAYQSFPIGELAGGGVRFGLRISAELAFGCRKRGTFEPTAGRGGDRQRHFSKSLVPVFHEDGRLTFDEEEYPRPQTTLEGLAALKPALPAVADFPPDVKGTTYRRMVLQKISRSRD
jgi:hypothetical protein